MVVVCVGNRFRKIVVCYSIDSVGSILQSLSNYVSYTTLYFFNISINRYILVKHMIINVFITDVLSLFFICTYRKVQAV